jgi:SAM-dependent methyltransferase
MGTTASPAATHQSYDPEAFSHLFAVEDRHFWFQARNRVLEAAIAPLERGWPDGYRVLEVGCGSGFVLRLLERLCRRGVVVGMDLHEEGLALARRRVGCRLVRGDVFDWPFPEPFHLIGLFDVLEHLDDDVGALRQLRKGLAQGGRLVLTVPAHMALWSYADTYAHHRRRYGTAGLREALQSAGFQVEYLTQFFGLLYPLAWLARRRPGQAAGVDAAHDRERFHKELRVVPGVNGVLRWLLSRAAFFVRRRWRLPLGTSLLAIAR